jgi:hypothetical protein
MTERRCAEILAAALVSCFSFPACKGCGEKSSIPAERPCLAGVVVKPIAPTSFLGVPIQLDSAQLAAKAKKVLEDAKAFAPSAANRPAAQVSLEAEVFSVAGAAVPEIGAKVRLRITIRPSTVPARFFEDIGAVGQAPLAKGDVDEARAAFQRLAERTVEDLLLAYVARQKLWEGNAPEIASALGSNDNELRVEVLRIVAARNLRDLIPTVLRLLSDEDENVRDAALGTLVALRERDAVKVLAASRHMRDAREMRKILDAIATLGGREAQEYLSFVAETHDDEEIRDMAKEALERLSRHDETKQPTK